MVLYEAMVIVSPDLAKEEHEEVLKDLSTAISKSEGKVDTILDWRKRRLAYEVDKKYQEGHYYLVYFSGKGNIIPEIEHFFRVTDSVIRYMIVRTDEHAFEEAAKKAASEAAAAEKAAAEEAEAEAEKPEAVEEDKTAEEAEVLEGSEKPGGLEEPEQTEQEEKPSEAEAAEDQAGEEKPAG